MRKTQFPCSPERCGCSEGDPLSKASPSSQDWLGYGNTISVPRAYLDLAPLAGYDPRSGVNYRLDFRVGHQMATGRRFGVTTAPLTEISDCYETCLIKNHQCLEALNSCETPECYTYWFEYCKVQNEFCQNFCDSGNHDGGSGGGGPCVSANPPPYCSTWLPPNS